MTRKTKERMSDSSDLNLFDFPKRVLNSLTGSLYLRRCQFCLCISINRATLISVGGWEDIKDAIAFPCNAGIMKNALACSTWRRSFSGIWAIWPLIFLSADARLVGLPVMIDAYLSAASSLYLERVLISNWLMK